MFSKLISFICLAIIGAQIANGQNSTTGAAKNVLILPYNPLYYMSDADKDIAATTEMPMTKVREMFNLESERKLYMALRPQYNCISLLQDTTAAGRKDLFAMMGMLGYEYAKPTVSEHKPNLAKVITLKTTAANNDSRTAATYMNESEDTRYMKATVANEEKFVSIAKKYEADYVVILTQMEIKTNMKVCVDPSKKLFDRELILHFCVYDQTGKLKLGNFGHTFFSNENSTPGKIIGDLFPFISDVIKVSIQQL